MCAMHPVCCAAHASRQGVGGERARKAKIRGRPFALTGALARCVMLRHQGSWQRASTPSSSNLVLCFLEVTCPPRSGCCLPAWPLCGFDLEISHLLPPPLSRVHLLPCLDPTHHRPEPAARVLSLAAAPHPHYRRAEYIRSDALRRHGYQVLDLSYQDDWAAAARQGAGL